MNEPIGAVFGFGEAERPDRSVRHGRFVDAGNIRALGCAGGPLSVLDEGRPLPIAMARATRHASPLRLLAAAE